MGDTSHEPDRGWCLAYGVVLHATDDGIIVEGEKTRRLRLHDRRVESAVVETLSQRGDLSELPPDIPPRARALVIDQLRALGAIVPSRERVVLVDRLGVQALPLRATEVLRAYEPDEVLPADLAIVLARRSDAGVASVLERCRALHVPTLLVWTARHEVVVVHDEGASGPCAICALFFDGRAAALSVELPIGTSSSAARSDHEATERMFVEACVARFAAMTSPLAAGAAFVLDVRGGSANIHHFPRRPGCTCTLPSGPGRVPPPPPSWDALARERFPGVMPLSENRGVARVAYRGSRTPWPLEQSALGVAIAAGVDRRERALGEAVERFCMLHTPPSILTTARRALAEPTLSTHAMTSLLFRDVERETPGFRFGEPTDVVPLDWSWASHAQTRERLLVPTSLVGRPTEGSPRLVDATSNGYACHPSLEEAKARALLELLERDALLLRWYASEDPIAIADADVPAGTIALLATADVKIPVVIAAACLAEGSIRIGSAAATSFNVALARALDELEGQLAGPPVMGPRPELDVADRGYGPADHVAHYTGAMGRALFERWSALSPRMPAATLRERWPAESHASSLDIAVQAATDARLDVFFVDRSLPDLFGEEWHVVRALVPGAVEMSWGMPYRRLASPRITEAIRKGARLSSWPHPYA